MTVATCTSILFAQSPLDRDGRRPRQRRIDLCGSLRS